MAHDISEFEEWEIRILYRDLEFFIRIEQYYLLNDEVMTNIYNSSIYAFNLGYIIYIDVSDFLLD